jgi:hypothetical protein
MAISLTIFIDQLADGFETHRLVIHDDEMPPHEVVSLDCASRRDAEELQDGIATLIVSLTSHDVDAL